MRLLGLSTFRHGVHPPEWKDDTSHLPIRRFPFAPVLVVPLIQHLGKPSLAVVREGENVVRGQRIARPDGFMSVAMHAPAAGTVRRIGLTPSIAGRMVPGIYLEPHPGSTQEVMEGRPCTPDAAPDEILAACTTKNATTEQTDVAGEITQTGGRKNYAIRHKAQPV